MLTQVTLTGQIIKFLGKTKQIKKILIKSSSLSTNERGKKTEKKENNKHDISLVFRGVRQDPKAKVETIL